jgi:hypothetical protein
MKWILPDVYIILNMLEKDFNESKLLENIEIVKEIE